MASFNFADVAYIKVSPGIGMARVGNSSEYFIGPEATGMPPAPSNGNYKEPNTTPANGKVRSQAARFRVYGYNSAGEAIGEITHDPANGMTLGWEIHLVNKKAANYAFQGKFAFSASDMRNPGVQPGLPPDQRTQLIIDPGEKQVSGVSQGPTELKGTIFDGVSPLVSGSTTEREKNIKIPASNLNYGASGDAMVAYYPKEVVIGKYATDEQGRLIIIGGNGDGACLTDPPTVIQKGPATLNDGTANPNPNSNGNLYFNNPGWYDDTAGGSIHAAVHLVDSGSGKTFDLSTKGTTHFGDQSIESELKRGWVATSPPKYVPTAPNVVSLLDVQLDLFPEADPYTNLLGIGYNLSSEVKVASFPGLNATSTFPQTKPGVTTKIKPVGRPAFAKVEGVSIVGFTGADKKFYLQGVEVTGAPMSTVGPAMATFNGKLYIAIIEDSTNQIYLASTKEATADLTFKAVTKKTATPRGYDPGPNNNQSLGLTAFRGQLYMALNDTNGRQYLGVQSPVEGQELQFNFQEVSKSSDEQSSYGPCITHFDGRLYFAYAGRDGGLYLGHYSISFNQNPLNPAMPGGDDTPRFDIDFFKVDAKTQDAAGGPVKPLDLKVAPSISEYIGRLYCAVVSGTGKDIYLGSTTPIKHVVTSSTNPSPKIENQPFSTFYQVINEDSSDIYGLDITDTSNVDFYKDIYPVLKNVTNYAWINDLAYQGHKPNKNGDFLSPQSINALADPSVEQSNFARFSVFKFLRLAGWKTNVPAPPKSVSRQDFPDDENQQGLSKMPVLAGTGGSAEENNFNGTKFPNQWLSLTRNQLAKFMKWVNGDYTNTTEKPVTPKPLDQYTVAEQPQQLDFSALELTVGGGFHPGIELTYYMGFEEFFSEPFRFAKELEGDDGATFEFTPGTVSGYMSIPWHGDFWSCNTKFWAPQRPDIVVKADRVHKENWFRSTALKIPADASSNDALLYPGYASAHNLLNGNETTYEAFLRYWSYFGFVTETNPPVDGETPLQEQERAACLDAPDASGLCPAVNPFGTATSTSSSIQAVKLSADGQTYTITGHVKSQSSGTISGLKVQAFDKDLIGKDDKLGSSTTNDQGMFQISIHKNEFGEWIFDKHPDLYFHVYDANDNLIKHTKTEVLKNVKEDAEDIIIDIP